jgi:hypothetical protein
MDSIVPWEELTAAQEKVLNDKAEALSLEAVRKKHNRPVLTIPQLIALLLRNPDAAKTEVGQKLVNDGRFKNQLTPELIAMFDPPGNTFASKQQKSVGHNFKTKYDALMLEVSETCKQLFYGLFGVEQGMLGSQLSEFPQPDYNNIMQTYPRVFENFSKLDAYLELLEPYIVMPTWKQQVVQSKKKKKNEDSITASVSFTQDEYGDVLRAMGIEDIGYYTGHENWISGRDSFPLTFHNGKFEVYPSSGEDSHLQEYLDYWCTVFDFFVPHEVGGEVPEERVQVAAAKEAEQVSGEAPPPDMMVVNADVARAEAPEPSEQRRKRARRGAQEAKSGEEEGVVAEEKPQPQGVRQSARVRGVDVAEEKSAAQLVQEQQIARMLGFGGGAKSQRRVQQERKQVQAAVSQMVQSSPAAGARFPTSGANAAERRKMAKALVHIYGAFSSSPVFQQLLGRSTLYKKVGDSSSEPTIEEYSRVYPVAIDWYLGVMKKRLKLRFLTDTQVNALNFIVSQRASLALRLPAKSTAEMETVVQQRFAARSQPELVKVVFEAVEMTDCFGNSVLSETRTQLERMISQLVTDVALSPDTYSNSHLNVVLTGAAGAGKTRFAMILGNIMKKCGLLLSERAIDVVSKPDLVGQYVGQSGPKTKSRLFQNLENVMFIDEAYSLAQYTINQQGGIEWDPYGMEVMTEIVNFLDKFKGRICIIAAGYEEPMMNQFFAINEGLPRRFPFKVPLPNYTPEELTALFCYFLRKNMKLTGALIEQNAADKLLDVIKRTEKKLFPNSAGDVENLASLAGRILKNKRSLDPGAKLEVSDLYSALLEYCKTVQKKGCLFLADVPVPTLTQRFFSALPFSMGVRGGYAAAPQTAASLGFLLVQ